jgi:HPt (histidine-containing phosphotransfer) domain-containing protein
MSNDLELYQISGMSDTVGKPFSTQDLWRCLVKYLPVENYTAVDKARQSVEEEKMQRELKINFVKTNKNTYDEFINALREDDSKLAHRIVHTLKSNAGQINKKRLQTIAAAAESALSEGVSLLTKKHTHELETELKSVLDELEPLLEEAAASNDIGSVDTKEALELLDKLEPLLDNMDTDCLNLIGELHGVENAQELISQIEGYNFKPALESLKSLRKELMGKNE